MNKINLRKLEYSPFENPFLNKSEFSTDDRIIKTQITQQKLVDHNTGQITDISMIHVIEKKSEEHFLETFADGVKSIFNLSRTAYRAFVIALQAYQDNQNNDTDSVTLIWKGEGVNGKKLDMVDKTFHNGIRELINKGILQPKLPNQYWVNPVFFFKKEDFSLMNRCSFLLERKFSDYLPSSTNPTDIVLKPDLLDDGH
ncbi:hypothetical protein [Bartonella bilalgolemii]|uniref:Plasmid replication protein RepL domain-containing protein n=1 Tax=Bartonella bilalgolemii TaxID=2942911 RepID=A0ABT0PAB3_9HYPH|nr:hypothetical protein [Bartonella sp. G70]MCL6230389.1 hypothetical protein [Bartonella sp. G70]